MRHQGKIRNWKDKQGFGFISPDGGGKQVFVHIKSFSSRQRRPVDNDIVSYELKTGAGGRSHAASVAFIGERMPSATSSAYGSMLSMLTAAFLAFVAGAVYAGKLPFAVLGIYLAASSITFGAYALDKSAARNIQWRIQESILHLFSLIGGWPGAVAAQRMLRHKSRKQSFQIVFWATVVLNCGALAYLFTPSGAEALHAIPGPP